MIVLKRIAYSILFLCGLVLLLVAASYVFYPKNNMKEFGMDNAPANGILGERDKSIDVVVLGDSESFSAISPMEIWKEKGFTSFICGSPAQTLDSSQSILKQTFVRQTPKVVIMETNAIYRKVTLNKYTYSKLTNYFSIFRFHDRWKNLRINDFNSKINFTWTDDQKGYIFNKTVKPSKKKNHMRQTSRTAAVPEMNKRYIQAMKKLCDERKVKFILVSTPSTLNWNMKRHNGIKKLARELDCEYVDLNLKNKEINIDWQRDTRDKGDHLNYYGAVKVSKYLANFLSEKKTLKDYRKDSRFKQWDGALARYETTIQQSDKIFRVQPAKPRKLLGAKQQND